MATPGQLSGAVRRHVVPVTSTAVVRDFGHRVTRTDDGSAAWMFPNGTYGHIEVDGVVGDEHRYAHFQWTPFAEWRVTVSGDGLDLSGLGRVVIQFAGSAIPRY